MYSLGFFQLFKVVRRLGPLQIRTLVYLVDLFLKFWTRLLIRFLFLLYSVSWGFLGASFGDILEKDIAESLNGDIGGIEDIPIHNGEGGKAEGESNGCGQENSIVVSEKNGSISTERWSLIDDILQVYKEHSTDMQQQVRTIWK